MDNYYYLGLDIGTESVGWAVTDKNYFIPKFKGNSMWGIRLFDESKTAADRRTFRCTRRRTSRSKERLNYLEMLFNAEISKIDISFYQRLKESNLYLEDKSVSGKYCVFNDADFTDKDFHKKYPTIYHLRKELITNKQPKDVRLVFLAIHHIIKNRGHFLFDSISTEGLNDFNVIYNNLCCYLEDNYDVSLSCDDIKAFELLLKDKSINKTKKNAKILELFNLKKKDQEAYILSLLSGSTIKLCDIFDDESLKDVDKKSISFTGNFDDSSSEYEAILGERFELIEHLKSIYDWALLADILDGEKYISFAKVKTYEKHKTDLILLKQYVKTYLPDKYNEIFKQSISSTNNYVAYSKHIKKNSKTGILNNACNQEEFCEYLKKTLGACKDENFNQMFSEIELSTFMPKQVSKNNSVIPMQINRAELIAILDNVKEYLSFLNEEDENGISVYQKIVDTFDFKIPYYIGPLNNHSGKYWIVRTPEKIYPWNIKKVVDYDKTAEAFIENLTSKCSYLPMCDVIPKNSLLYSKYMVLNELNNLRIDNEKIDVNLKQSIYKDLFEKKIKVRMKDLKSYLNSLNIEFDSISGIDIDFKSSLKPQILLNEFDLTVDEKEDIIKAITIFGDDKKLLKKRIEKLFSKKLSENEIKKICKLKFKDWSNLSREFLTGIECIYKPTGEIMNIINALWNTNFNLMQLLYSNDFASDSDDTKTFIDEVDKRNSLCEEKTLSEIVEELYVSPKVKRPIYQSLLIAKEIEKIQKCPPKKIFVEVARGPEEKKEPKLSRKQNLLELYKNCKKENKELYESLCEMDEDKLRSDKLLLYYCQFGKCMYTGKTIDLDTLMHNNDRYDIDHIFPQSKIKDDSLNNRVLVDKVVNEKKSNEYPLSEEVRQKMQPFWSVLLTKGLISQKKYDRLVRKTPLSDKELSDFISRQLVETMQSTKAVAQILKQLYPNTDIVYVKAGLVSEFRKNNDMLKCREINDFHHAKDAYLNIVVGNVYDEKFTRNKANFIEGLQRGALSLNRMFDYSTKNAWVADNQESMNIVRNTMRKNNIRYTRYAFEQHGGFFDQNPVKKGHGQIPIKSNGAISDISKYGAYNNASSKYFSLVRYVDKKGKTITQIVPIDAVKEKDYLIDQEKFVSMTVGADAKIIMPKIKYNACLSFNGFRMHISSKSSGGAALVYKPGIQLVLSHKQENYFKKVIKYLEQFNTRKINKFDHISNEENMDLYDSLTEKFLTTVFNVKFSELGKKMQTKRNIFISLETEQQCYVLAEIVKIVHANVMSGDLTFIKEAKKAGVTTTSSKISELRNITSVKLINQSITGLFENEIDLLK